MGEITCQVCSAPIHGGDFVACRRCFAPVHRSCWDFNERCPIFGCGETGYEEPIESLRRASSRTLDEVHEPAAPAPIGPAPALEGGRHQLVRPLPDHEVRALLEEREALLAGDEAQRMTRELVIPVVGGVLGGFLVLWGLLDAWPVLAERLFVILAGLGTMGLGIGVRRIRPTAPGETLGPEDRARLAEIHHRLRLAGREPTEGDR